MDARPTGRTRYRVHKSFFGAPMVVLQIEWKGIHTYCVGGFIDSEWMTFWRDASIEDVTEANPVTPSIDKQDEA